MAVAHEDRTINMDRLIVESTAKGEPSTSWRARDSAQLSVD